MVGAVVTLVQRSSREEPTLATQWFAPYVDATLTPLYPFEDASAVPTTQVVLGFVVANPSLPCSPSWGAHYSLEAAATAIDLDRRIARLRSHGKDVIVSFGGVANQELANACTDPVLLQGAYQAVVDRYRPAALDLDLEGAGLDDAAAMTRRAAAIAAVQQAAGGSAELPVWLTVPVGEDGLPTAAQAAVGEMLRAGVEISGVNAMTMNFGPNADDLRPTIRRALTATTSQVQAAYRDAGQPLTRAEAWRKTGATPMIGLNDTVPQQFDLATATWLVDFARDNGMGRLSMWSLNRDGLCGSNIDANKPSPHCSGLDQRPREFTLALAALGQLEPATATTAATPAGDAALATRTTVAPVVDDPATSPYPIWNPDRSYQQGRKVVWHGNVYVAKWFSRGEMPDGPSLTDAGVPWRLIGPLLPGETAPTTTTIPAGTYATWDPLLAYDKGSRVQVGGVGYEAKWWTRGDPPGVDVPNDWDTPWKALGVDPVIGA